MTASPAQDLFAFSFQTRAEAGEQGGLDFLRPDAYTAEQVLVEVVDMVTNPDNIHVESVEIRRVGRVAGAVKLELKPIVLSGGNASVGFCLEYWTAASDMPSRLVIDHHAVASEKLVELLSSHDMESVKLYW